MKDLHIHTRYSDGEFNEFEIIKQIEKNNIKEFAICDHDTIEGSKKVFELVKDNPNFIFHSGVELSCIFFDKDLDINIHILFYDFDYNDNKILEVIKEISCLRKSKIKSMVAFVEKLYNISIPTHLIEENIKTTNSFGKPHLYSIISQLGNFDREEYYKLMNDFPSKNSKLNAEKTLLKLKNSGKAVLAHPVEIMKEYNFDIDKIEELIIKLKSFGLKGIEAFHSSQTFNLQTQLSSLAKKHNLFITKGSDFHGPNIKPGLNIGNVEKI